MATFSLRVNGWPPAVWAPALCGILLTTVKPAVRTSAVRCMPGE